MYSSFFVLVVVINLSLSGAQRRNPIGRLNDDGQREYGVLNFGNGENRHNVAFISNGGIGYPNRAQSDSLVNRFGSESTYNSHQPRPGSSVTNIGNGYGNRNTVSIDENLDKDYTRISSSNGGSTYIGRNGADIVNVGYGPENQNTIISNGRVIPSNTDSRGGTYNLGDCYGRSCDRHKNPIIVSNTGATNQLLLSAVSFLPLLLLL